VSLLARGGLEAHPFFGVKMSANDTQIGGLHYKGVKTEHWDYAFDHQFDFFQYQITKYVERWKLKGNGVEDLKKARHFLDKYIEVMEKALPEPKSKAPDFFQWVKPTGWVMFEFEGSDGEGFHYRCASCRLRLPPIQQFDTPWNYHDAQTCTSEVAHVESR
jgi:hypothetical protein